VQFFTEEEREEILTYWDNGTGFYKKNGCALPRHFRSLTCLEWRCRHSKQIIK
jgi:hypothetical protein